VSETPLHEQIPLHEQPHVHERRWFILGVLCLSLVMVVMAVSSLNVALPTMQQDLETTSATLQWIIDAYALVFAGLLLLGGALGDRFGRKGALLVGLLLFGAGGALSGLADTVEVVISGRAVQGVGAALVMPATLSIITAVFPPEERQRAIAVWVGFAGAGGAIGPVVSGALLEHYWWGSAFLVNLPVVLLVAVSVALFAPRSKDDAGTPLDPTGAVLSLVGLGTLLFGIIEGPERGWTDGLVLASFAVAAVTLAAFAWWESRSTHPMLPIELFGDRRFSVGASVITLSFFVMFGFFFLFSLYLQFARGYSPLDAGVAGLPFAATMIVVSPRSAALVERLGPGRTMAAGLGLVGLGMGLFSLIRTDTPYLVLVVGMVLLASGMAITVAPATGGIMAAVPLSKAGVGSAVNDTTRELGGALGIAIFGTIVSSAYRTAIDLDGLDLPSEVAETARESVGGAIGASSALDPAVAADLYHRAASAFADAYNAAALVAAAVMVVTAVAVLRALPHRRFGPDAVTPEDEDVLEEGWQPAFD
jgi:EmrB/QacA subfamily drug resistance transporter